MGLHDQHRRHDDRRNHIDYKVDGAIEALDNLVTFDFVLRYADDDCDGNEQQCDQNPVIAG